MKSRFQYKWYKKSVYGGYNDQKKKDQNSFMELRHPLRDKTEKEGLELASCLKQKQT